MRALIMEKLISTRRYSEEAAKFTPIRPSRTQHTCPRTRPRSKKVQYDLLADMRHERENYHRARRRKVCQPHHVLAAAKLHHRRLRSRARSRGSDRSSNMRRTLRGIIDP